MIAVETVVRECLDAFERLDLETFIACFAEDATAWFPATDSPGRVQGRDAIRARLEPVFAAFRARHASRPGRHRLVAEDLDLQWLGPEIAIATFHLLDVERFARRAFVLARGDQRWRIAHLHASNARAAEGSGASDRAIEQLGN